MKSKMLKIIEEKDAFVQIPRAWRLDYIDRKITYDEFSVYLWLALSAKYFNGKHITSYEAITSELSGKYKTNRINKIMLSLKSKQYIWYPSIKGSRRPFEVEIGGYLLPDKTAKDISHHFNLNDRDYKEPEQKPSKEEPEDLQNPDEDNADNEPEEQKLKEELDEPPLENLYD